jgi:hypothetical protein
MPPFSFHRPGFLHFHSSRCSRSPKPSPPVPHDDAATLNASLSSSLPSPRLGVLEQDVNVATSTSRSSADRNSTEAQHSTRHLPVDKAPQDVRAQPSRASPVIRASTAALDSTHMLGLQGSVTPQPSLPPRLLNPAGIVQLQQSLVPLHSPYSLTTSYRQSLDSLHLTVSCV